jgi:hypothetical protein
VDKKIAYTVLIGDYELYEPTYINKNWELICFTDQNITSKNWSIVHAKDDGYPRKKAREIKIRCDKFLDFDLCLFIDSKFTIKCNLDKFIEENMRTNITLMEHNKRVCAYDEAKFCINNDIGNKKDIQNQINFYKQEGFPLKFGLYGTGILIRKNKSEVIEFMKQWYNEIEKYSCRDQISFSYVLWKNSIKVNSIPFKETYRRFI